MTPLANPTYTVADAGGVVERLEQMMERLDAAHPSLPARDPDASTVDEAVELIQSLLAQVESLRLAICGGEDAPGYAASLTHEQVLKVAADNLVAMRQASELGWDGETGQSWKSRAIKAEAERDDLQAEREELRKKLAVAADALANGALWLEGPAPTPTGARILRMAERDTRAALQPQGAEHG